jgi:hypothetical protein
MKVMDQKTKRFAKKKGKTHEPVLILFGFEGKEDARGHGADQRNEAHESRQTRDYIRHAMLHGKRRQQVAQRVQHRLVAFGASGSGC